MKNQAETIEGAIAKLWLALREISPVLHPQPMAFFLEIPPSISPSNTNQRSKEGVDRTSLVSRCTTLKNVGIASAKTPQISSKRRLNHQPVGEDVSDLGINNLDPLCLSSIFNILQDAFHYADTSSLIQEFQSCLQRSRGYPPGSCGICEDKMNTELAFYIWILPEFQPKKHQISINKLMRVCSNCNQVLCLEDLLVTCADSLVSKNFDSSNFSKIFQHFLSCNALKVDQPHFFQDSISVAFALKMLCREIRWTFYSDHPTVTHLFESCVSSVKGNALLEKCFNSTGNLSARSKPESPSATQSTQSSLRKRSKQKIEKKILKKNKRNA